jgi:hypothetical protein
MQKWLVITAVTLFTLTQFLLMAPPPAFACSCMPSESVATERDRATAVFAGEVTEMDAPGGLLISSADPVQVTFNVSQVWKGPQQPTITLTTPRESASCGVHFETGAAYLVYAVGSEDELQVFLCSRTAPLAGATADLTALGEGSTPLVEDTAVTTNVASLLIVIAGLFTLLLVVGLLVYRHRRQAQP